MHTKLIKLGQGGDIQAVCNEAAELLRQNMPVVFPTETVYGVGASAASHEAIARLQEVKGRPEGKPFTVHLADPSDAEAYVADDVPRMARRLMRKVWPGPLTLILDAPEQFDVDRWRSIVPHLEPPVPQLVYQAGAVGLRCPANEVTRGLLRQSGLPIVASSANLSGHEPPLDAQHAQRELDGLVPLIIDTGPTRYDAASTIVRVQGEKWTVLREGVLAERYLRKLMIETLLFVCTGNTCRSPMAEAYARREAAQLLGSSTNELETEHGINIISAGLFAPPGMPASEEARKLMRSQGLSLDEHRSRPLSSQMIREADAVYCMTAGHRQAVLDLAPEAADKVFLLDSQGRDVHDPIGGGAESYRTSADQIRRAVEQRMKERFQ